VARIILWTAAAAAAWTCSPAPEAGYAMAGLALGAIGGALQWRAIASAKNALAATATSIEAHRALRGTKPGRAYQLLFWCFTCFTFFACFATLAALGPLHRLGASDMRSVLGPLTAYAAFALARDAVTFYPLILLARDGVRASRMSG
jgi:hypothetical protein